MLVEAIGYFACVCLSEHPFFKRVLSELEMYRIHAKPPAANKDVQRTEVP
jgi:hypothetical protein